MITEKQGYEAMLSMLSDFLETTGSNTAGSRFHLGPLNLPITSSKPNQVLLLLLSYLLFQL